MTRNQIEYWKLKETERANTEVARANRARELETARHNIADETETQRSNTTRERETERNNRYNNALGNFQTAAQVGNAVANMAKVIVPSTSVRYPHNVTPTTGGLGNEQYLDNFFGNIR